MFRHILLPTDGSPLSEAAMRKGIQFAKTINARVTGFCVVPALPYVGCEAEIVHFHFSHNGKKSAFST
jgi:nucleotide-binding universal stress UspA family protein